MMRRLLGERLNSSVGLLPMYPHDCMMRIHCDLFDLTMYDRRGTLFARWMSHASQLAAAGVPWIFSKDSQNKSISASVLK